MYAAAVAIAKVAASAIVIASGFRAVSDDDFARAVIAEEWARSPRWDASGTSWLPFPFWITGAAMMVLGRGLGTARAAAIALGIAAALIVYLAARWLGEDRGPAAAGAAVAAVFPWSARLGVATVPELFTGALTLLGVAAIASQKSAPERGERLIWGAAALAAASLSRYEAWPVAATFAVMCSIEAARSRRAAAAIAAGIAALGPASWVIWNRVSHGDALHFVARVTAYRQALGAAEGSAPGRLAAYPLAMVREEPEIVALLVAAIALVAWREGFAKVREPLAKYALPAGIVAVQIAALSFAMMKDGAPTHHPERAVMCALLLIAVCAGAIAMRAVSAWTAGFQRKDAKAQRRKKANEGRSSSSVCAFASLRLCVFFLLPLAAAVAAATLLVRPSQAHESFAARTDEVAAGRAAASMAKPGERVLVEVADYGYLAVTAALGRPEDVIRDRSVDPRDAKQPSSFADAGALGRRVAASGARWVVARVADPARAALGEPVSTHGAWGVFHARGAE